MIILNDEELQQLEAVNNENVHLNRAIKATALSDNKHAVSADILTDQVTWFNWVELLQDKPREDVVFPATSNENLELE